MNDRRGTAPGSTRREARLPDRRTHCINNGGIEPQPLFQKYNMHVGKARRDLPNHAGSDGMNPQSHCVRDQWINDRQNRLAARPVNRRAR